MSGDEPGCHRQEVGVKGFSGVGGERSGTRAGFSRDGTKLAALPVSVSLGVFLSRATSS